VGGFAAVVVERVVGLTVTGDDVAAGVLIDVTGAAPPDWAAH